MKGRLISPKKETYNNKKATFVTDSSSKYVQDNIPTFTMTHANFRLNNLRG